MKSNYQIIFSILLIAISLISISGTSAKIVYSENSPYLRVVAEEVNPEPVEPGQDVTVKIRLINDGGETANNVSLKLNADYPFFIKTESNNLEEKKTLCITCLTENTYYLSVDANAISGIYPLNFEIHEGNTIIKPASTINIKVVGKPDIVLETKAIKANVSSGDKFIINFNAKNIGTGIARNVKIIPQSDNILMLGSNINVINEIYPGKTVSFKSAFIVKDSLAPDTYKFPIQLEFIDEQGKSYKTTSDVGINVLKRADVDFQSIKTTPTMPTINNIVHLEGIIENTGTGDADKVIVELITPQGKTYKAFVGQLKADDDAPFYFDTKPKSIGVQNATLKVSYYDDFGFHSYKTSFNEDIKKASNNIVTISLALIVAFVIIGYFYHKKKRK